MKIRRRFYTNLLEKREALGISPEELATEVSVNAKTIRRIEAMESEPSVVLAMRISAYFGMTVDEMFWE